MKKCIVCIHNIILRITFMNANDTLPDSSPIRLPGSYGGTFWKKLNIINLLIN